MVRFRNTIALVALAAGLSCVDRSLPPEQDGEVLRCAHVNAWAVREDGTRVAVPAERRYTEVCDCVLMEDALEPEFTESISALALEECRANVEDAGYDPDESDCQQSHDMGYWAITWPPGDYDDEFPPCYSAGSDAGCGR